jgi:type I restriction enzyme S subunit
MARRMEFPEGWKISLLDSVTKRGSGHTPDKEHPEYWNGGIKWVSLADSHRLDAGTISETDKEISELGIAKSSAVVHPSGTVILSRDAGVGKSAVLDGDMAVSQHFIAWRCSPSLGLQNWFLYSWLQFNKREFERQAVGSTIKTIGLPYFKRLQICYPPYAEQSAIVEIIRTWDRAIETVEALIANARAQKQALMQQLLPQGTTQPKKRLPGFSGVWREVRLGNLVKEVNRDVDWDDDATYKLISVRRRSEGIFHRESLLGHDILTKAMKVALAGDFLISKMQIVHGASALVTADFDGFNISGSYIALVPKDQAKLDIEYFDWYSRTPYFYKLAYISSYGVHIEKMTFNLKSFLKQAILIPPSKAEQSAIVERLNSAEALIAVYRKQADALRQEKAALMQQLLTGKRRVKLPESPKGECEAE